MRSFRSRVLVAGVGVRGAGSFKAQVWVLAGFRELLGGAGFRVPWFGVCFVMKRSLKAHVEFMAQFRLAHSIGAGTDSGVRLRVHGSV